MSFDMDDCEKYLKLWFYIVFVILATLGAIWTAVWMIQQIASVIKI